ncbi:mitochondrial mRNA pseudouridine synthase Trub2 [Strongylocentrotus purpuratus]|uniref:Pseudouridine synthase II N-terminal domain-containing protein n=1 Tax=Strongylocentrotus purpuratus TaxID=7668 RepID=A0A7M7PLC8_STRPU|nr:mitochondrial mRNA pseudouridine synthase Trub2 [Strongylocentrotus purpuratus]
MSVDFKVARKAWRSLSGLFAVYKPEGLSPQKVKHIVKMTLLEELNALKQRPQNTLVKIVPETDSRVTATNPGALKAMKVPSFTDHPLVRGPAYRDIAVSVVSMGLDTKSCGVMVLAVRDGKKLVSQYQTARLPRHYTIRGRFGVATDTHDSQGKVWQKTTYDHITMEKLDRITSNIHRSFQRELIRQSGVDIQSQEAYELAVRGLLHPVGRTNPLLTDITCTMFEPPEFELELTSYADTAQYLRKVIHDIGQELKSSAIATQVRRTHDGPFNIEHALLKKHWKLNDIAAAIEECRPLVRPSELVPLSQSREAVRVMEEVDQRWNQVHQD